MNPKNEGLTLEVPGSSLVIAGQVDLKEVTGMSAYDGDTISVDFDGEKQDVRYVSINTPGFGNSDSTMRSLSKGKSFGWS